jgi:recombinational DNA repair protein (RecF pathway)
MEWSDEGIVLALRPHGESSGILEALTRHHGRHLGLVRGGSSSKGRAQLQPGNLVKLTWRARLAENLGIYVAELSRAGGEAYRDRLLALPQFLLGRQAGEPGARDALAGLELTAHFLTQWVLAPHHKTIPDARNRLTELAGRATESA